MPLIPLIVWGFSALASGVYVGHTLNQSYNRKVRLEREQAKQEKASRE